MSIKTFNTDLKIQGNGTTNGNVRLSDGAAIGHFPEVVLSANATLTYAQRGKLISMDTTAATRTVTMPALTAINDGIMYIVKHVGSNLLNVAPTGADKVNSVAATYVSSFASEWLILVANFSTTNWELLSSFSESMPTTTGVINPVAAPSTPTQPAAFINTTGLSFWVWNPVTLAWMRVSSTAKTFTTTITTTPGTPISVPHALGTNFLDVTAIDTTLNEIVEVSIAGITTAVCTVDTNLAGTYRITVVGV